MEVSCYTPRPEVIAPATRLSGLVNDRPESLPFYVAAFAEHPVKFVTYFDLRKLGFPLGKAELKQLGLRGNVIISAQFVGTLNGRGLEDPLEAAATIGHAISTALCSALDLTKQIEVMGDDWPLRLAPSVAASGACCEAQYRARSTVPATEAPILPLTNCDRAGQCCCFWTVQPR